MSDDTSRLRLGLGSDRSPAGSPSSPYELLTGVATGLSDQLRPVVGDDDVALTLAEQDGTFSRDIERRLGRFARSGTRIVGTLLGDAAGRRVSSFGVQDGQVNLPDRRSFERPPYVHAVVDQVGEASAQICKARQLLDGHLRQELSTAQANQGGDNPRAERIAAWTQRGLIVPIATGSGWLTLVVARRVNGWPAAQPEGGVAITVAYGEVAPLAAAVVLLGLLTGLCVASERGLTAISRMLGTKRPRAIMAIGAALSAAIGTLSGTAGAWQLEDLGAGTLALGALVWALIGVMGYGAALLAVIAVQNRESNEELADIFARIVSGQANKKTRQAEEALAASQRIHDALLRTAGVRATVLVSHYYRANLLARRNSRDDVLLHAVEGDIIAVQDLLRTPARPLCVCDLA